MEVQRFAYPGGEASLRGPEGGIWPDDFLKKNLPWGTRARSKRRVPKPPRATRNQPEFMLTVILGETTFSKFFGFVGLSLQMSLYLV